jgi:hypothetical protein
MLWKPFEFGGALRMVVDTVGAIIFLVVLTAIICTLYAVGMAGTIVMIAMAIL